MKPPPFDVAVAERWFAIELNNAAWDLLELKPRTPEQAAALLAAAQGARQHWYQVGTPLNKFRADALVATAYLAVGAPELALRYANACEEQTRQADLALTPFDQACRHGLLAGVMAKLGKLEAARAHYAKAASIATESLDPEERPVFERFYPPV